MLLFQSFRKVLVDLQEFGSQFHSFENGYGQNRVTCHTRYIYKWWINVVIVYMFWDSCVERLDRIAHYSSQLKAVPVFDCTWKLKLVSKLCSTRWWHLVCDFDCKLCSTRWWYLVCDFDCKLCSTRWWYLVCDYDCKLCSTRWWYLVCDFDCKLCSTRWWYLVCDFDCKLCSCLNDGISMSLFWMATSSYEILYIMTTDKAWVCSPVIEACLF
jgi:hypothetical protein